MEDTQSQNQKSEEGAEILEAEVVKDGPKAEDVEAAKALIEKDRKERSEKARDEVLAVLKKYNADIAFNSFIRLND